MSSNSHTIERMRELLSSFAPSVLDIRDDSSHHKGHVGAMAGGGHYHLVIASLFFEGHSLLHCHRMVKKALSPLFQKEIHALSISIVSSI